MKNDEVFYAARGDAGGEPIQKPVAIPPDIVRPMFDGQNNHPDGRRRRGGHQEPETKRVYREPAAFTRYRQQKKPGPRVVLDELVDRFKKARDEKEVAVTVRQLAESCKMSKSAAENAINVLVEDRAIVIVSVGKFEGKRKPSCYRLTMFPCRGKPPTNDYIEDVREWRRASNKRSKAAKPMRVIFEVPAEQAPEVMSQLNDFIEAS